MNNLRIKLSVACIVFGFTSISLSEVNYPQFVACYVKYSGLFDRHIQPDYSVIECVNFLNNNGIKVNWLDFYQNKPVNEDEMARIVGQTFLMLSGEKRIGTVYTLPKSFNTWQQFCNINGLNYKKSYKDLLYIINKL